jgi:signal transduction histidine kinase
MRDPAARTGRERGTLGLRSRIVGAVVITTVLTLLVAALALLGPLENKLKASEFETFTTQVGETLVQPFRHLGDAKDFSVVLQSRVSNSGLKALGDQEKRKLLNAERTVAMRTGASGVALIGLAGPSGAGATVIAHWPNDLDLSDVAPLDDVTRALRGGRTTPIYSTRSINGTEYARAAIPFATQQAPHAPLERWVLSVRRPFAEVNDAVHTVRMAFLEAAGVGLVLTLLLAIPLASRIVRRLRRLRHAARELAEGRAVTFPGDRARDEVGDLARTFSLMQAQLRRQEEARRAFVATASHELRTPLTSLEGMLELLDDELETPAPDLEDARAMLRRARAQSHRLARLAADLLDLSRIDAQVSLRSEPVELRELSRAVLAEFGRGTAAGVDGGLGHDGGVGLDAGVGFDGGVGLEGRVSVEGEPVWALGDPGSVARILRILIDNALRVSPEAVEVTVHRTGGAAVLSVCDEGPGVPEAERALIFQRFKRGRNTSGQAGFGLGLAIGRELAERMGGTLDLEDRPCPGAAFTLRLPTAAAPDHEPLVVG